MEARRRYMDARQNPFSPGAGSRPPELAGRGDIVSHADAAIARVKAGRSAQSLILLGLRGTGKTVLLNEIENRADAEGYITSYIEAPEDKTFPAMLYPQLRQVLRRLSTVEAARQAANSALGGLKSFAKSFKISISEVEIGIEPSPGVADSGDLSLDLVDTLELVGKAAQSAGRAWALLIDEVQYLQDEELSALIVAVHRASQKNWPILVVAAGLPQIAKLSGDAKSYAERLFDFPPVGSLTPAAAEEAIRNPLAEHQVEIEDSAVANIIEETKGYPFFLQEWGYHAWNLANDNYITLDDVKKATKLALNRLDNGFFKVRIDRLTKAEVDYVVAMARMGKGPYNSTDVASALGKTPTSLGPRRASIIKKGMIYSPQYGEIDFTVPLFDEFVRRWQAGSQ